MSSSPVKIWETDSPKNAQLQTDNTMGIAGQGRQIYPGDNMSYPSTHSFSAPGFLKEGKK